MKCEIEKIEKVLHVKYVKIMYKYDVWQLSVNKIAYSGYKPLDTMKLRCSHN